jgi:hypothetical protein
MRQDFIDIQEKVNAFKKRYYFNVFVKGFLVSISLLLSYWLVLALLEYALWLPSHVRFVLLVSYIGIAVWCLIKYLYKPFRFWLLNKGLTDIESAGIIGQYLPEVKDKLVNFYQLQEIGNKTALAQASLQQRATDFAPIQFAAVIKLQENKKYGRYLAIPLLVIILLSMWNSGFLTTGTKRIIQYQQKFSPPPPFQFHILGFNSKAYFNEDYTVRVQVTGQQLPQDLYLIKNNQRIKMQAEGNNTFSYTTERLQQGFVFQVEGAGFFSTPYEVKLLSRPELTEYEAALIYPRYLKRKTDNIQHASNLEIPEGTKVRWSIRTMATADVFLKLASVPDPAAFQISDNQLFTLERSFKNPDQFEISLQNNEGENKEKIKYNISIIKDQSPQISVTPKKDSVLYQHIMLGGTISDDYANTKLVLHSQLKKINGKVVSREITLPIAAELTEQRFFYFWRLDTLALQAGDRLEYFLEVWDNDGVNGLKSTRTANYLFAMPSQKELETNIRQSEKVTLQKLNQSYEKAKDLDKKIENLSKQIKSDQKLDWQDKNRLEEIIRQKKELENLIQDIKKENQNLNDKKEVFTEQDQRIKEKAEQIQKLMDSLLDEETKKLFEELEKLLKENSDQRQMQNLLDRMEKNSSVLEKELNRTLELFKQFQLESKVEQATEQLKELIEKQEALNKQTQQLDKNAKGEKEKNEAKELSREQENIKQDFKELEKKIDEIKNLDEEVSELDLNEPTQEQQNQIENLQEQSKKELEEGKPTKAKEPQQKALQEMNKMQKQMEEMGGAMGMEMDSENLESLRQIVHGLVKLSFDQENILENFKELGPSDPRFNVLAQAQIKVKNDSKVLEDSLLALGKRDPFMGAFVTKEITELNAHLDKAIEYNGDRRRPQALSEMQLSMTSINNLALMLDDHFNQMMEMMAKAKPGAGKSKKKGKPQSLAQMQQQLNQKIQELKNSGKGGKELSEELAKSAAEQERIRKALEEFQEKMKGQGKDIPGTGDLLNKMEQSEIDLVNKQLTDQLIKRQKDIETRLLEAEKAMREQDEEQERKGETAKDYKKEIPKAYEEYLRLKEKEVELLKTVPPRLYPYYKQEVNDYFKRIRDQSHE